MPTENQPDRSGRDLHKRELFSTSIPVMVNHLNYGNHLGYDSVLSIMQEARMRWLKNNGMTELSVEGSVGYMITHASVSYEGEGHYGDQLQVKLFADSLSRKGFQLSYEILNETTEKVIAVAETRQIFFDFVARKIATAPEGIKTLLLGGEELTLPPR